MPASRSTSRVVSDTVALYPAALAILVAARVHGITKNGLTMAYAGPGEGLMRANASVASP